MSALDVHVDGVVVHATSGAVAVDHVILALPPALAVDSITFTPDLPARVRSVAASTAVWMGTVVKAVAVYDAAFWRDAGLAGAAISHLGPFHELHDHSGPDGRPAALFGFASAAQFPGATTEQIAVAFSEQLTRLFGAQAAGPRQVHVADWSREQYTSPPTLSPRGSSATYGHPLLQEPVLGRLHWASTETAPEYAGHVEGAIHAGTHAARAVARLTANAAEPARTRRWTH